MPHESSRLVLVLFLIGGESGASFFNQSQSLVTVARNRKQTRIIFDTQALFTVTFSHFHYNVFERGREAISSNFALFARN